MQGMSQSDTRHNLESTAYGINHSDNSANRFGLGSTH
jgi:hypothetical protein